MDKKFNGTTVETNGVRSIAGGGTGATTSAAALTNLGAVANGGGAATLRVLPLGTYNAITTPDANTIYIITP